MKPTVIPTFPPVERKPSVLCYTGLGVGVEGESYVGIAILDCENGSIIRSTFVTQLNT